jgi:hypothetical protein
MDLAEKLQTLARRIPGVAGYQDQESSRDTDKLVRLQLASRVDEAARLLENGKRLLAEQRNLKPLPRLEQLGSKLARVANAIRFASRGYHGFFDARKIDQATLEKLYGFDLELVDDVDAVHGQAASIEASLADEEALRRAADQLSSSIDALESAFNQRQNILSGK